MNEVELAKEAVNSMGWILDVVFYIFYGIFLTSAITMGAYIGISVAVYFKVTEQTNLQIPSGNMLLFGLSTAIIIIMTIARLGIL